jgi:hypothetical protein
MKTNLSLLFLILFLLSTTAFAGITDPKKESEKSAVSNPRENKLSDEEVSRLSKRAETDNLSNLNLSNNEKNDSRNNLKPTNQIIVEHNHHGYYYGIGVVLLIVLLVVLLV